MSGSTRRRIAVYHLSFNEITLQVGGNNEITLQVGGNVIDAAYTATLTRSISEKTASGLM